MALICRECGKSFVATNNGRGSKQIFCQSLCKKTFNNRRMTRGAVLYDLVLITRYERGKAKLRGVWAILCEVCRQWREEDRRDRGGRPSWRSYGELHDGLAPYRATVIGSAGASSQRVAVENGIAARSRAA